MRLCIVLLVLLPGLVSAEEQDVLILHDGTVLTGAAVEIVPERLVRMNLGEPALRDVVWGDIVHASGPSFLTLLGHPEQSPGPGRVPVDLSSVGPPLRIGRREAGWLPTRAAPHGPLRALCMTPCRLYLEPGFQPLEADGVGIEPNTVEIPVPPTGARVSIHAPPRTWSTLKYLLLVPAVGTTLLGSIVLGTGFDPGNDKHGVPLPRPDWSQVGVGVALLTTAVTLGILTAVAFHRGRHGIASLQTF